MVAELSMLYIRFWRLSAGWPFYGWSNLSSRWFLWEVLYLQPIELVDQWIECQVSMQLLKVCSSRILFCVDQYLMALTAMNVFQFICLTVALGGGISNDALRQKTCLSAEWIVSSDQNIWPCEYLKSLSNPEVVQRQLAYRKVSEYIHQKQHVPVEIFHWRNLFVHVGNFTSIRLCTVQFVRVLSNWKL